MANEQTLYASRVGQSPSTFAQRVNNTFGSQPYRGNTLARSAPNYIYGRPNNTVQGANLQSDIPQDTPQPQPQEQQGISMPPIPEGDVGQPSAPQQPLTSNGNLRGLDANTGLVSEEVTGQDMAPSDWTYDKQPMPKDPTDGQKKYTPEHLQTGAQAVTYSMQNGLPPPQSDVQAATRAQDESKIHADLQRIAGSKNPKKEWEHVSQTPFYKSSNFFTGVMNTGLAIMSGANPLQAFHAGQDAMNKGSMAEQIGANRQYLEEQGYAAPSIEAAITSGDAGRLKMQEMSQEDQMQAQNEQYANRQQYQQDVNQQQTQQSNAEWDRRNAITAQQQSQREAQQQASADARYRQRADDMAARQKALIDYRNQAKAQQAQAKAQSFDFDSRTINAELKAPEGKSVGAWSVKLNNFDVAQKDLDQATAAIKSGNNQEARNGYQQALLNVVRGEIGENRSIQAEDLAHFGGDPSAWVRKGNEWSMKAGAAPTQSALNYLAESIKVGGTSARGKVEDLKNQRIRSLSRTMDKKRATALVNRAYGGGWHDPLSAFEENGGVDASQGALAGQGGEDYSSLLYQ